MSRLAPILLEVSGVLLAFAICAAAAFGSGFFAADWLSWLTLGLFAALLLALVVRAVIALLRKRIAGFGLRLVAAVVLLPLGLAVFTVASIGGKWMEMSDGGTRVLPFDPAALAKAVDAGRSLAAQLTERTHAEFSLESIRFESGRGKRTVEFEMKQPPPGYFRAEVEFISCPDGTWKQHGSSFSGDTETFEAKRALTEPQLEELSPPSFVWPVSAQTMKDFEAAAAELAGVLQSQSVLGVGGAEWKPAQIVFSHDIERRNNDAVEIRLDAHEGRERVAYASTYWDFDGRLARLANVSAGTDSGAHSSSTMEQGAEVRSVLEEWFVQDHGVLAQSASAARGKGGWQSCEATLTDGTVLTYFQKSAHPFLAEYDMRLAIRAPGEKGREFVLPMNTGGRTAIFVSTGTTADGTPAVHVDGGRHFNAAFLLRGPRFIDPAGVLDQTPAGAFVGISTPLRWVVPGTPDADKLIQEARDYGKPAS